MFTNKRKRTFSNSPTSHLATRHPPILLAPIKPSNPNLTRPNPTVHSRAARVYALYGLWMTIVFFIAHLWQINFKINIWRLYCMISILWNKCRIWDRTVYFLEVRHTMYFCKIPIYNTNTIQICTLYNIHAIHVSKA